MHTHILQWDVVSPQFLSADERKKFNDSLAFVHFFQTGGLFPARHPFPCTCAPQNTPHSSSVQQFPFFCTSPLCPRFSSIMRRSRFSRLLLWPATIFVRPWWFWISSLCLPSCTCAVCSWCCSRTSVWAAIISGMQSFSQFTTPAQILPSAEILPKSVFWAIYVLAMDPFHMQWQQWMSKHLLRICFIMGFWWQKPTTPRIQSLTKCRSCHSEIIPAFLSSCTISLNWAEYPLLPHRHCLVHFEMWECTVLQLPGAFGDILVFMCRR